MSSLLIAFCVIGSLTANPSTTIPAGIPTEVMSRFIDEYVPLEDAYTKEEINLIQRVVQSEMGSCDVQEKSYVASVVFNMINHPTKRFGKTVKSIIYCKNRFCKGARKIDENTKKAVRMAYEENTAPGCYAFNCHKRHCKKFAGWTYKFTDKYGVNYYGE